MKIQENTDLQPHNTFGVYVKAQFFTIITSVKDLKELLVHPVFRNNPHIVLGGGSNLLFADDFKGLVIKIELKGVSVEEELDKQVILKVAAGEIWHDFVLYTISNGYFGLENLSLIPGTVGAAPIQNIGAYGVELEENFYRLEAVEKSTGKVRIFEKDDCSFGYRNSVFKQELKDHYVITQVYFILYKDFTPNLKYKALQEAMKGQDLQHLNARIISDKVIEIRRSKLPDPLEIGNAGSFFKNPVVTSAKYNQLMEQWPNIPGYGVEDGIKIPAGWLIETAGWKGKRIGNVGVHEKQALVLVNYGGGTGPEVMDLARRIQDDVKNKFGIELEPEVNILENE